MSTSFLVIFLACAAAALGAMIAAQIRRAPRRTPVPFPSCGGCGYNVGQTLGRSSICPECGGDLGMVGVIPPRSPTRWTRAIVAVGLLFALMIGVAVLVSLIADRRAAAAQAQLRAALAARQRAAAASLAAQGSTTSNPTADQHAPPAELAETKARLEETDRRTPGP